MKTVLIPKNSRFFPSKAQKLESYNRVIKRPLSSYNSYLDWFYAFHIDPVQRWIHALGMLIGTFIFILIPLLGEFFNLTYYVLGTIFFYGSGVASHKIYDMNAAKVSPKYFFITFFEVVKINLLTLSGQYDQSLRKFVQTYPFIKEDFQLEEVKVTSLLSFLLSK